jgi:hypothetical protein
LLDSASCYWILSKPLLTIDKELSVPPVIEPRHLISPNIHAIIVHFPLGLFMFGLMLEILGLLLFRNGQVRQAARWMLLFGGLLAVPAALSGIDAYHDVSEHGQYLIKAGSNYRFPKATDASIKNPHISDDQYSYMRKHVLYTSFGAGLAALAVTAGLGLSLRRLGHFPTYSILLLMVIGAATLMGVGAHFAGEAVYLQSFAVGMKAGAAPPGSIDFYAPARETHIALAGVAIAAALGALGATLRLMSSIGHRDEDAAAERELAALTAPANPAEPQPFGQRRVTDDMTVARTLNADAAVTAPRMPAGRFWLLSTVIFLAALGFGVLFLVNQSQAGDPAAKITADSVVQLVKKTATETTKLSENRRGFHIVIGIALVLYPLLLAIAARFLARAKWLVASMCLFMVLLIGAEIWLGVLMSYRGAEGTIYRFPTPTVTADTDQ